MLNERTSTHADLHAAGLRRWLQGVGGSGGRTREILEICRNVWAREAPLTHDGPLYPLPLPEGLGTGLGKALKIIAKPVRSAIPVYVAALGEKNVSLTAEVADGWLPLFFMPEKIRDVFGPALDAGTAKRPADLGPLDIC